MNERLDTLERHERHRRWLTGPLIWLIAALVGGGVLWIAVDYTRSTDRAQRAALVASHNKLICLLIGLVAPSLKSYENAAKDPSLTPSAHRRNAKRIVSTRLIRDALVTVPPDYRCPPLKPKGGRT